jgi:hypothetical protein
LFTAVLNLPFCPLAAGGKPVLGDIFSLSGVAKQKLATSLHDDGMTTKREEK